MCEHPVTAWLDTGAVTETGKHPLLFKLPPSEQQHYIRTGEYTGRYKEYLLPCGKCFGCKKQHAWNITVRASFEARCYDFNSFITLTCADQYLSEVFPYGVRHRPWQLFAKRLRKKIGKFRYLMCAEYGSRSRRPHYHAIIFGHRFVDVCMLPDGNFVPSKVIAECWPYGHIQVADVNEHRVAYVAGYTLKDYQTGRDDKWYLDRFLNPPYVRWSRRPGLGAAYFDRHWSHLVKHQDKFLHNEHYDQYFTSAIFRGSEVGVACRYFSDRLQLHSPSLYDKIKLSQELRPHDILLDYSKALDKRRSLECQKEALLLKNRDIEVM